MPGFVPSWLVPADPAAHYAQGFGLGLQQEAQQSREALALEELNRRAQEQAASERQFAEQMQLQQQQLAIRQAEEQRAASQAAQQQQARMEYQSRISAGEDPLSVLSQMWPRIQGATPEAALIRAQMQAQKAEIQPKPFYSDGKLIGYYNPSSGAFQLDRATPVMTQYQRDSLVDRMRREINKMMADTPNLSRSKPDPKWSADKLEEWAAGKARLKEIQDDINALKGIPETPAVAEPTPEVAKPPAKPKAVRDATGRLVPAETVAANVLRGTLPSPAAATAPPTLRVGNYYGTNRVPPMATPSQAGSQYGIEPAGVGPSAEPTKTTRYQSPFKSPDEVYRAWKAGKISKSQALEIDSKQFGLGLTSIPLDLRLPGLEWNMPGWQPKFMRQTSQPSQYE